MKRAVPKLCLVLLVGLLVTGVTAQTESGKPPKSSDQPIDITAKKFTARNVADGVEGTFDANVKVTQADMTLSCDHLVVMFEEKNDPANKGNNRGRKSPADLQTERKVKTITASDNVKFVQGDRMATAGRAVYDNAKRTISLSGGPPRLWQGPDVVEADTIVIFLDENRTELLGGEKSGIKFRINPAKHEKEK
jgi:lipopolysaccharide export system protein LptA